jgi:hypothetical protein
MRFKITFQTEYKINAIKAVRNVATDFNIEVLKGLREAKTAVENGLIVDFDDLNRMLNLISHSFRDGAPDKALSFNVEPCFELTMPVVMPKLPTVATVY